ncbi:MAG: ferredoxin [Actinomycetota bacterium]
MSDADPAGAGPDLVLMTVDDTRCIGGGQCEMLAPDVFEVDDDTGIAAVVDDGRLDRADALELIDRCPSGAVSFTELVS